MAAQNNEDLWQSPYIFKVDGVTIVLENHTEKNLRAAPGKGDGALRADGGFGKFARWEVNIKDENGTILATFKNEKTGDYLRINKDGELDCSGKGGKWCWFKIHRLSQRVSKFESNEHAGKYLAVGKDGEPKVGNGGKFCRMDCLKQGAPPKFSLPYRFKQVKVVVLEHRDYKNLRTAEDGSVKADGGKGEWAQWEATPGDDDTVQFKNVKTGDYLRMKAKDGSVDAQGKGAGLTVFKYIRVGGPNEVRLKAVKADKFLSLDPQNGTFTSDDGNNRKSIFNVFRDE